MVDDPFKYPIKCLSTSKKHVPHSCLTPNALEVTMDMISWNLSLSSSLPPQTKHCWKCLCGSHHTCRQYWKLNPLQNIKENKHINPFLFLAIGEIFLQSLIMAILQNPLDVEGDFQKSFNKPSGITCNICLQNVCYQKTDTMSAWFAIFRAVFACHPSSIWWQQYFQFHHWQFSSYGRYDFSILWQWVEVICNLPMLFLNESTLLLMTTKGHNRGSQCCFFGARPSRPPKVAKKLSTLIGSKANGRDGRHGQDRRRFSAPISAKMRPSRPRNSLANLEGHKRSQKNTKSPIFFSTHFYRHYQ